MGHRNHDPQSFSSVTTDKGVQGAGISSPLNPSRAVIVSTSGCGHWEDSPGKFPKSQGRGLRGLPLLLSSALMVTSGLVSATHSPSPDCPLYPRQPCPPTSLALQHLGVGFGRKLCLSGSLFYSPSSRSSSPAAAELVASKSGTAGLI